MPSLRAQTSNVSFEKRVASENIIDALMAKMDSAPFDEIFTEERKKFEPDRQAIIDSLEEQKTLLEQINAANEEFVKTRSTDAVSKQREAVLQTINVAVDQYNKLTANLNEGLKFYGDLMRDYVAPLKQTVSDFVFAREQERKLLLEQLQADAAKQAALPAGPPARQPQQQQPPQQQPQQQQWQQPPQQQQQWQQPPQQQPQQQPLWQLPPPQQQQQSPWQQPPPQQQQQPWQQPPPQQQQQPWQQQPPQQQWQQPPQPPAWQQTQNPSQQQLYQPVRDELPYLPPHGSQPSGPPPARYDLGDDVGTGARYASNPNLNYGLGSSMYPPQKNKGALPSAPVPSGPAPSPSSLSAGPKWSCPSCTFQNEARAMVCFMCNTDNPNPLPPSQLSQQQQQRPQLRDQTAQPSGWRVW